MNLRKCFIQFIHISIFQVVYSWILCMVSLAAFLKLNFLVKASITLLMAIVYNILIFIPYKELFLDDFLGDGLFADR